VSSIDTPGVIERVSNLFQGHATLIGEFNTFLPAGYRIAVTEDPNNKNANSIRVSTPTGTTTHTTVYRTIPLPDTQLPPQPQDMQSALDFVQKIKTRYADEPDRYKKFLEILSEGHPSGIKHVRRLALFVNPFSKSYIRFRPSSYPVERSFSRTRRI
jgi:paired amphipathic helix protein Sin3a